jgi:hypothetical protein
MGRHLTTRKDTVSHVAIQRMFNGPSASPSIASGSYCEVRPGGLGPVGVSRRISGPTRERTSRTSGTDTNLSSSTAISLTHLGKGAVPVRR